jgi:hypothetical protein
MSCLRRRPESYATFYMLQIGGGNKRGNGGDQSFTTIKSGREPHSAQEPS